ncbi:inhibitor of KinA [Pontibacter ummariensis]|uniref:Inhibitor of KinA n=2 Tax=Pontibacter ummariensis TaxID=1610492 RepID=A0A239IBS4_9BACT|nr:inhibitor of KinA [Pontibacter ummariensis]SNS90718.1 inhibitor of KinA [Pontibacter ummariensis]
MQAFRLYPLGDTAIVVQLGHEINDKTHAKVRAFAAYLEQFPFTGMLEYVPAFTTVTIYYNPWVVSERGSLDPYEKVTSVIQTMLFFSGDGVKKQVERVVEIPVLYGGEYGPDLEFVATHNALTPEEVIAIHASTDYQAYMIGFAPGFPYLGGMNARIAAPRKETPLASIPAGSVGIAGKQTGIYPIATPGGWQLIGRTPLSLFDPARECPSLLKAGDRIRFVPISEEEYQRRKEQGQ